MAGSFATWEVDDPHDMTQSLAERFAPPPGELQQYWARTYEAADWRRYKIEPDAHRTRLSVGLIGGVGGQGGLISLASLRDRAATKFYLKSPGLDFYCLSFIQEGSGELRRPGNGKPISLDKDCAAIFQAHPKTALLASDGSARLNIWLPVGLVHRYAATLLNGSDVRDIDFDAAIDCRNSAGASLRRLVDFLFSELARPDSLFANPISAAPVQELLVQSISHEPVAQSLHADPSPELSRGARQYPPRRGIHPRPRRRGAYGGEHRASGRLQRARAAVGFPTFPQYDANGRVAAGPVGTRPQ